MNTVHEKGQRAHPFYHPTLWHMINESKVLPAEAHAGLVFERFPCCWWLALTANNQLDHASWDRTRAYQEKKEKKNDNDQWKEKKEPLDFPFLKKFCAGFTRQSQNNEDLLQAVHHRMGFICRALGGVYEDLETQWRFVTGLGAPHPLENGFTFDRAAGVPYLPGSSVKGVARAGAELHRDGAGSAEQRAALQKTIDRIFGPEGDEAKNNPAVGSVIFFDAYPTKWPKLEPDIMNPHYQDYYTSKGNTPPADYLDPVPIFFLTVAPRTAFRFMVGPRAGDVQADATQALQWLKDGLQALGAGAKTAAGYGAFRSSNALP